MFLYTVKKYCSTPNPIHFKCCVFRIYFTIDKIKRNDIGKYNKRKTQLRVETVKEYLKTILKYRESRGWSEYQLAEHSGLPQSTISSWYRKSASPSIGSLEKICAAFGITLSQLFAEGDTPVSLTESQKRLLERWAGLSEEQQEVVFALIDKM